MFFFLVLLLVKIQSKNCWSKNVICGETFPLSERASSTRNVHYFSSVKYSFWTFEEGPVVFEAAGPYELTIQFPKPYPIILDRLGRTYFSSDPQLFAPKHYLQQWHADYSDEAASLAEEEGFEDWTQAFRAHLSPARWYEPDRPWVWRWIPVEETTDRTIGTAGVAKPCVAQSYICRDLLKWSFPAITG